MFKYNGLRRRQTYDEIIDYLQHRRETIKYPQRIKLYPRGILDDLGDVKAFKTLHKEDKETQTELKMSDKATQTDLSHKAVQVDVGVNPNEYHKRLRPYDGEEVINYRYWFNWYIKDKATQTSKFTFMDRREFVHPVFTPPSTPVREKEKPPLYEDIATDVTDVTFAPVNLGLTWIGHYMSSQNASSPLHYSPPVSNINSPASSVTSIIASSRPISVASSRPVSVASSRPVSVHSSPHYPVSPQSPSYLPVPYEEDSPASSSSSKCK